MRRRRLIWQLYPPFLLIALISLILVTWHVSRSWENLYLEKFTRDLEVRIRVLENQVTPLLTDGDAAAVDRLLKFLGPLTNTRYTLILPNGQVLADSERESDQLDNHADRPEIQEALRAGFGTSRRLSYTLGEKMIYAARPLIPQDEVVGVLRAAVPVTFVDQTLHRIYLQIAGGGLLIVLVTAVLSLVLIHRLSQPLEEIKRGAERLAAGDLSAKLSVPPTDELGSLAEALNHMAAQLDDRFRTILRQRQEQEAILSSMVEGVIAVDNHDHLITLNKAGGRLLQVDPQAVQNLSLPEVIRNKDLQRFLAQTRTAVRPMEGEIVLPVSGDRFIQVHGSTLRDPQGQSIGVLLVLNDVTRLRRLERVRRDFVANVSHELRTPITSIKGFVETLLGGALAEPENAVGFLKIIARQADRLNQIIEDLLTLSRIEQEEDEGKVALKSERLRPVLLAAVQVSEMRAADKHIKLVLECPPDLQVPMNAPLLEGALVNLIDNAVKYSPADSTVTIDTEVAPEKVVIRVQDQGRGISPQHLPRLFERFYRVDPSRSRKMGGTGLGLAIVKHIAQAHGGWVSVDSQLEQGSVFAIHLPSPAD